MTIAIVLAAFLAAVGAPPTAIVLASLAIVAPWQVMVGGIVAVGVLAMWRRRTGQSVEEHEAARLRDLAADVESGMSLRAAIAAQHGPLGPTPARCAQSGASMRRVGAAAEDVLPMSGGAFAGLVGIGEEVGVAIGPALRSLAADVDAATQAARDRRVALAQIRLSAVVVGVVPLVLAVAAVAVRGVPEPGGPIVVVPMAVGASLMLAGSVIVLVATRSTAVRP